MNADEKVETLVTLDVPPGYRERERLDVYLTGHVANATRAKVQAAIKEGRVAVNDAVVTRPSHPVSAGDRLVCRVMRLPALVAAPEPIPLSVVYEDDDLLVVDKPAGLVVHPAYGHRSGTLVNALLYHVGAGAVSFEDAAEEPDDDAVGLSVVNARPQYEGAPTIRPGIVHRIDKDTSGLLVVAKHDVAHAHLAGQFERHTIERSYLGLVWGVPEPPRGRIETHLGRDARDRRRVAVVPETRGKRAVTHYSTEEVFRYLALVRFRLETGRTHQIRVHAQHLGHPLFGDGAYGGAVLRNGPSTASRRAFVGGLLKTCPRQALHAQTLGFVHPRTGAAVRFESPMPADLAAVLDRLRAVEPA
jgi:23S rRNA pseudouridine1911/1915/1917 synthase